MFKVFSIKVELVERLSVVLELCSFSNPFSNFYTKLHSALEPEEVTMIFEGCSTQTNASKHLFFFSIFCFPPQKNVWFMLNLLQSIKRPSKMYREGKLQKQKLAFPLTVWLIFKDPFINKKTTETKEHEPQKPWLESCGDGIACLQSLCHHFLSSLNCWLSITNEKWP